MGGLRHSGPDVAIETGATLLEREREISELRTALGEARQGRGQVVVVEAPAGLGKTSLLRAAADMASETGFSCLTARAGELERDFAYGCVRQLLEPAVANASEAERRLLFQGAAGLALPLFAPMGAGETSPDSSFSMLHGLYWLLGNLTDEGPLVLSIDDLHWSDAESLRLLNYLAPRLDGLPLAVVASRRPAAPEAGQLARLATAPETRVLKPKALSAEATATLCERRIGPGVAPEFADACREATGGNPFYLEALLRETSEQGIATDAEHAARVRRIGPTAVAQTVLLRLSGSPAAATALVRAVAVLGDGAGRGEAARLAGIAEDEAIRAADLLAALAILRPADVLEFAHPIVREAVYADIGAHERARGHARAAALLAADGAAEERVAAQIMEAEPAADAQRVVLLRRVAADALARGAPSAAAAALARALSEPPPPGSEAELLFELGSAELRLAAPGAVDHLAAAVERFREPPRITSAVRQLAGALTVSGDSDRAVDELESAIEIVEPQDRELGLLLDGELATHALQAGLEARARAAERLSRHRGLAGATPGERLVLASLAFERARASGSASEAADHLEGALDGGRLLREHRGDIVGVSYDLVVGLLATDALDVADACLDQALADARARASIPALAWLTARRGWVALRRGDVARADADARTALELLTAHGIRLGRPFATGLLVEALVEGGETYAAERALRDSALGADVPPGITRSFLLEARGLLHIAQGRMQEGYQDLVEFGRRDELWGAASPLASRWRSRAALALFAMGDAEAARRMAGNELERARRWGAASGIGIALRAVALAEGGDGSVDRLREAAEVLAGSPARLEHARALTDLGAALRRSGRRADARDALQQGLELAERCTGRALAERARTELRAAGGRSSDPEGSGVEQLTASERRVAELAAAGNSNPEIAQTLFVTRKTVETHLGHVYSKLDISGRGELGGALAAP